MSTGHEFPSHVKATVQIVRSVQRMACTSCGAEAHASCNCGKPYVPAKQRAAEAIAANPQKSSRAIAADIGVGPATVDRVRNASTASREAVEGRVGLDGKTRQMPDRKVSNENVPPLATRIVASTQKFTADYNDWLETKPKLSQEARDAFANAIFLCAEEYERIARHIQKGSIERGGGER